MTRFPWLPSLWWWMSVLHRIEKGSFGRETEPLSLASPGNFLIGVAWVVERPGRATVTGGWLVGPLRGPQGPSPTCLFDTARCLLHRPSRRDPQAASFGHPPSPPPWRSSLWKSPPWSPGRRPCGLPASASSTWPGLARLTSQSRSAAGARCRDPGLGAGEPRSRATQQEPPGIVSCMGPGRGEQLSKGAEMSRQEGARPAGCSCEARSCVCSGSGPTAA